ncbi:MAG: DMT family transporter [Acidobacteriota bacterium]|nr:DMT family transporter [Blastocatellia bacterium]MDW8411971.1 DMT family transporter [Acidobacteriota bacterium]
MKVVKSCAMSPWRVYLTLAFGIACISTSSILVKYLGSREIDFLAIAFYRLLFATLLTALPFITNICSELRDFNSKKAVLLFLSGLCLALHFGTWTLSLGYIPVARSVLLVTCHPILTAMASYIFLGEPFSRRNLAASLVAFCGVVVILLESVGEFGSESGLLVGDVLALCGAVAIVGYIVLGRRLRSEIGLASYTAAVYAVSSAVLFLPTAFAGVWPWTLGRAEYFWLVVLALVPTIGGHTVFNYLLKDVSASLVSTAFLGEPVGAALLAWAIWGQIPSIYTLVGGILVMVGIYLVKLELR